MTPGRSTDAQRSLADYREFLPYGSRQPCYDDQCHAPRREGEIRVALRQHFSAAPVAG